MSQRVTMQTNAGVIEIHFYISERLDRLTDMDTDQAIILV